MQNKTPKPEINSYLQRIENGKKTDQRIKIRHEKTVIGKSVHSDIAIANNYVSFYHCSIKMKDDKLFLRNAESRNGTYLNGKKLGKYAEELSDGAIFSIAIHPGLTKGLDSEVAFKVEKECLAEKVKKTRRGGKKRKNEKTTPSKEEKGNKKKVKYTLLTWSEEVEAEKLESTAKQLEDLFYLPEPITEENNIDEDNFCENLWQTKHFQDENGRYTAPIPWKSNNKEIGFSLRKAVNIFFKPRRKMDEKQRAIRKIQRILSGIQEIRAHDGN